MYWLNYLDRNAIALAKRTSYAPGPQHELTCSELYRRRSRSLRCPVPNLCLDPLCRLRFDWYSLQHVDHSGQGPHLPCRRHDDMGRHLHRHRSHQELYGSSLDQSKFFACFERTSFWLMVLVLPRGSRGALVRSSIARSAKIQY